MKNIILLLLLMVVSSCSSTKTTTVLDTPNGEIIITDLPLDE
mgnify:FL=1